MLKNFVFICFNVISILSLFSQNTYNAKLIHKKIVQKIIKCITIMHISLANSHNAVKKGKRNYASFVYEKQFCHTADE